MKKKFHFPISFDLDTVVAVAIITLVLFAIGRISNNHDEAVAKIAADEAYQEGYEDGYSDGISNLDEDTRERVGNAIRVLEDAYSLIQQDDYEEKIDNVHDDITDALSWLGGIP